MNDLTFDRYGRVVYNKQDLYDMLMEGIDISPITNVEWNEDIHKYNTAIDANHLDSSKIAPLAKYDYDVEEFDEHQQSQWFIPNKYKELDIIRYVWERTPKDREERVEQELFLYAKYDLLNVLRACVYLVDTMREHNIVWGVGRGSSVSSYVLYVLGIHKIDSVKYGLDISEFLK